MVEKYKLARKDKTKRFAREGESDKEKTTREIQDFKVKKTRNIIGEYVDDWVPKTKLGKMVKDGEIKSLDEIFDKNLKILEPLIVDYFIGEVKEKIVETKKTSYVRMSGRKYNFRCTVLIGDGNKYLGLGIAKDKDKWNASRKAARNARLNMVRIKKGCGSWQCTCGTEHSLPFKVEGKCGSVKLN
jgi:small subunit ribosomal protein S5